MSQQINLFNPIFLKTKRYFSVAAMAKSMSLLIIGSMVVAGYAHFHVERLNREAAATSMQLAQAQAHLARVMAENAPQQKSQALESQVARTELEVQALTQVFEIMQKGEIGNTKGYSEYLRAFSRQIVDGVWLTGVTLIGAGNEIGLEGRAVQPDLVAAYMNRLKREPVLQGKSFDTLEMQAPKAQGGKDTQATQGALTGYIEFSLH